MRVVRPLGYDATSQNIPPQSSTPNPAPRNVSDHHVADKHQEGPPPAPSAATRAARSTSTSKPATLGVIGEKKSFFHKMFHHDKDKDKHALEVPRQANGHASRSSSPHPPSRANSSSPPPTPGVVTPHPRDSDSEYSQPPSRAASIRRGQSDMSDLHAQPPVDGRSGGLQRRLSQRSASHGSTGTGAKSDTLKPVALVAGQPVAVVKKEEVVGAGGNKFTLKDLIGLGDGSGKLSRKPSAAGSAKGSDRGSTKGSEREYGDNNSTASLLKKYGICDKAAIGKGATAVVRLAHKWDRSQEKLYAVKVSSCVG